MTDKDMSLIDTTEEEQISLVRNSTAIDEDGLLMDNTHAIPSHDEQISDENDKVKEHPLASLETQDPWVDDNGSSATEKSPAESTVDDLDISEEPSTLKKQEYFDSDTSAVKGFQNVTDSDRIDDLVVVGQLPEWLVGEHFTVGPCTYDIKYSRKVEIEGELQHITAIFTFEHWFDALPLVNRFDLNGQRNSVTYRNKSTSHRLVEKIREHHGFAPQHPAGLYMSHTNQTVLSKFLGSSAKPSKPDAEPCSARVLANIPGLEGRLFAQNHANHIQELDPFDLKPTRLLTWNEINPKFRGTSSCPNGQFDARTGEYINFTMDVGYQSVKYHFFSISDRNPKGSVIASITAPMAYVNTFSITPKYIIFVICPMLANASGVKYNWNESIMDSFSFRPSDPTLFYVISREKGEVIAVYRSEPCFVFNHINAFEDNDKVCIDMICYPDDTIARQLTTHYLRNPQDMTPSRLVASEVRRYMLFNIEDEHLNYLTNSSALSKTTSVASRLSSVFGLFSSKKSTSSMAQQTSHDRYSDGGSKWYSWMPVASFSKQLQPSIELPQINPRYKTHKHQFMYGLGFSAASSLKEGAIWDSIVKTNMNTKQIVGSWHQDFCYPSEAVFIPKPQSEKEDEGVLISVVLNSAKATSFLLVLDANTMQVLVTADLERIVPISFAHGSYRLRDNP
ncbi:MAG: carotenoid oxygenase [Benjaminiella poitrasii]|nr:MAG: carotenoid oxygenase [Benjaminiella poitrasii]